MITYINHDVTNTVRGVVAHGVNCQGVMGSGVALSIKKKWPIAFERYHSTVKNFREPKRDLLGLAQLVNVGHPMIDEPNSLFVANMFTQEDYGRDGRVYASPIAIQKALDSVMSFCRGSKLDLYMPWVGCGLGGLQRNVVQRIIEQKQDEFGINVFVCDFTPS